MSTTNETSAEITTGDDAESQRKLRNRERISQKLRHDRKSLTPADDPDAVPAFETSAGIKQPVNSQPIMVNAMALENFNRSVDPAVLKHQVEAANIAAMFSKRAIRPDEIAALRRRMFNVVQKSVDDVEEVLSGQKQWNNVQVRLFSILTERVMPKLSSITVEDSSSKKLDQMSLEELEAIALGKRRDNAVDAVVKQGLALEGKAEAQEEADFSRADVEKLTSLASIEEAEKAYIQRKTEVADDGKPKKTRKLTTVSTRK